MNKTRTVLIAAATFGFASGCIAEFEEIDVKEPRTGVETSIEKDGCNPLECDTGNGNILLGNALDFFYTEFGRATPKWTFLGVTLPNNSPAIAMDPTWDGMRFFDVNNQSFEAAQLVGTTLHFLYGSSTEIDITIYDHKAITYVGGNGELNAFRMVFNGTEADVCSDLTYNSTGDPWVVVLHEDRFDNDTLTIDHMGPEIMSFACGGSVAGKIKRNGRSANDPWLQFSPNQSLTVTSARVSSAQALLKMLEGDFCGDGNSHTIQGTSLTWYDKESMVDNTEGGNHEEAQWTANGALCLNDHRLNWPMNNACQTPLPACAGQNPETKWTSIIPPPPPNP